MLNEHLVYLMNVVELSNMWKLPIHWDAKEQKLHFNPKLKPGFYISNFVMGFGIGILTIFLGSRILLPNTDRVPVFIVIFNILNMVGGMFAVFMQKLQYNCGTELLSFFLNIESIRVNLRTRGMKMFAIFLQNVTFIYIDIL
jgi:hypothetical protein